MTLKEVWKKYYSSLSLRLITPPTTVPTPAPTKVPTRGIIEPKKPPMAKPAKGLGTLGGLEFVGLFCILQGYFNFFIVCSAIPAVTADTVLQSYPTSPVEPSYFFLFASALALMSSNFCNLSSMLSS